MIQGIPKTINLKNRFVRPGFLNNPKHVFLILTFLMLINGLYAQTAYWSLDAGLGITSILVEGESFQAVLDPRLWL
jgi:hypothetical protein